MIDVYLKHKKIILKVVFTLFVVLFLLPIFVTKRLKIGNEYESKEDVALYIKTFHELPSNYITKYGMETSITFGGDLSNKIVGGDTHWNTNQLSEFGIESSTSLKECDIKGSTYNLITNSRGKLRLVYTANTKNVRVFFSDHYEVGTYEEITTFELQLTRNIFWIIFFGYSTSTATFFIFVYFRKNKKQIN